MATCLAVTLLLGVFVGVGVALAWLYDIGFPMVGCLLVVVWLGIVTFQVYAPLVWLSLISFVSFFAAVAIFLSR